jgi:pimeloyl-ACP methyl ester carboxylesterase
VHIKFVVWTLALWTLAPGAAASTVQASNGAPHQDSVRAEAPSSPAAPSQAVSARPRQVAPSGPPRSMFDGLEGGAPYTFPLDAELDALDRALATDGELDGAAPRSSSSLLGPQFRAESPHRYRVSLTTGTGTLERVWVQEAASDQARPLLVVFHRFGVSELDAMVSTRLFEEARRRQWYVIAPRSWGGIHFSSLKSQIHTERALTWAQQNFNIDPARIYAVGFSMGGGAALNYAARHLDPSGPRFAAVAGLSSLADHQHAYANEIVETQNAYDNIFGNGAPGSYDPWLMRRSSLFELDPLLQVLPGTDLARNLSHVNLSLFRTTQDVGYLAVQHDSFVTYLANLPLVSAQHQSAVLNFPGHSWDALDERGVCDWLRQFTLTTPTAANTLADEDGVYFHFEIAQDAPGAFSPFSWAVDAQANSLSLTATQNVQTITVQTAAAGLSSAATLQVTLAAADGLADEVVIENWPLAPLQVLRDGSPTSNWMHNPLSAELTLLETDPAQHVWQIVP